MERDHKGKFVWDEEAQVGYLRLDPRKGQKVDRTIEVGSRVNLDFGRDGRLLGIEFLSASAVPVGLLDA